MSDGSEAPHTEALSAGSRPAAAVAELSGVSLKYGRTVALADMTLAIPRNCMVGLIGPDGVGKSTLLSLLAGARRLQEGAIEVLGGDLADPRHRAAVCPSIAYMPQGLGKNLYPDLSVRENIEFFGRLFGLSGRERARRIGDLLAATGLAPFPDRLASKLSGGMRQKLGLCCALIHDPDLLILDEPTTGVDPLSRRQFWRLIAGIRNTRQGMSVVVATAYMEEAEQFDWLVAMDAGRILATGSPAELKAKTGSPTLEESFIALLPEAKRRGRTVLTIAPRARGDGEPVIVARDLTRRFGDFVAVDRVNFAIERGEIFGFLGSNGCGKTTTMKMLTGLLPSSSGEAFLFGKRIYGADMKARFRVGYMSQSFSLYTELTVRQNLDMHAHLFHLPRDTARARITELVSRFGLEDYLDAPTAGLPLGIRQRLSLAVAVVHEPELLILDEPTSGVDPLARDEFWRLLADLSRNEGVTVFVSTHFMNEAARCDRIALMDAGRVLASGTPDELVAARHCGALEEAFIDYLEEADGARGPANDSRALEGLAAGGPDGRIGAQNTWFSWRRLFAYTIREGLELWRDRIRLGFALVGTAFLMAVFGFGISTDVNDLSFAVLDRDNTPDSRAYLEELRGSRYFVEKPVLADEADLETRLQSGSIQAGIEIPPNFGHDLRKGTPTTIAAWIDGAMPFRAQTMLGYLQGAHAQFLDELAVRSGQSASPSSDEIRHARRNGDLAMLKLSKTSPASLALFETRYLYNQSFDSIYAMVPSTLAFLLVLIPAILMALAVVRERELGSITNLYVTPVTRVEFLVGKQLPYIAIAMTNFLLLCLMAVWLFGVPLKGSFPTLALGALLYVTATTGVGTLISAFCRTQIAALFGTAIFTVLIGTQFSGMMVPVASLSGGGAVMGHIFPMMYFLTISVGTFTKALGFQDLTASLLMLALFIPSLLGASLLLLRKQEA